MNAASNYFMQAELALASYAELQAGTPNVDKLKDGTKGLSDIQANNFAAKTKGVRDI